MTTCVSCCAEPWRRREPPSMRAGWCDSVPMKLCERTGNCFRPGTDVRGRGVLDARSPVSPASVPVAGLPATYLVRRTAFSMLRSGVPCRVRRSLRQYPVQDAPDPMHDSVPDARCLRWEGGPLGGFGTNVRTDDRDGTRWDTPGSPDAPTLALPCCFRLPG